MARPAKTPKHITLGPHQRWDPATKTILRDRDSEKRADDARYLHATPERIAKGDIVEMGMDRVQRITASPLDVLHANKLLLKDKDDHDGQDILFNAGKRFREHWHAAGLNGISAMDMGRVGSGEGNAAWMIPTTEYAAHHRSEIREAVAHIGSYFSGFVVAIVAEERDLADVGRSFTGRGKSETCSAIAIEVLRAALTSLAKFWGMMR